MAANTDHGLTRDQEADLYDGQLVYFTNHPCREAVAVTYVRGQLDNIRFASGATLCAFSDELSLAPRSGLGA